MVSEPEWVTVPQGFGRIAWAPPWTVPVKSSVAADPVKSESERPPRRP